MARWILSRRVNLRLGQHKLLNLLHDLSEPTWPSESAWTIQDLSSRKSWPAGQLKSLLHQLVVSGLAHVSTDSRYSLTPDGWQKSAELARNQRMWELILTEHAEWSGCLANLEHTGVRECIPPEFYALLDRELRERARYPKVLDRGH